LYTSTQTFQLFFCALFGLATQYLTDDQKLIGDFINSVRIELQVRWKVDVQLKK